MPALAFGLSLPAIRPAATPAAAGPGAHNYWWLYITANDGNASFMGLTELKLRDAAGVALPALLSSGGVIYSSYINASNDFTRAFDHDIVSSGWLSATAASPQYIGADIAATFGGAHSPFEVKSFDIYGSHNAPDASPKDFELQWSDDGLAWTTALAVTGETGWGAAELRTFVVF